MRPKAILQMLKDTFHEWSEDKAQTMGAALAYYSVFSIAPLVILAIAIAGLVFGEQAARGAIEDEIKDAVGEPVARAIEDLLRHTGDRSSSWRATIIGLITMLFGASGVFGQLQESLNTIWKVTPKPGRGWLGIVKDRFLSFTMVLGTGFLLLVSLVASAALSALGRFLTLDFLPGGLDLWQWVNWGVSFALITLLFAMIYKVLPDVHLAWRDVWVGAAVTALLFTVGKFLLGYYLGRGSVTSPYGAAGSLVVILVWVYYSSQILLFGAEFTRVYALCDGKQVCPRDNAVTVTQQPRGRLGMPRSANVTAAAQH